MKRRLVIIALVAFAVWPLVQRGLVGAYDASPWKLYGWAMYTAPAWPVGVAILRVDGERLTRVPDARLPERIRREMRRYAGRRRTLGRLASPDDLGGALFTAYPQWSAAVVVAEVRHLDRGTARVERGLEKYVYRRGVQVEAVIPE